MNKFSGTRSGFGQYLGEKLRDNHYNFYADYNPETLRRQRKIYEKYYPEIIKECLEIARVTHVDANLVIYTEIGGFVDRQREKLQAVNHGCTIFAVVENGKTFVGRNYDWEPQAREFFGRYDLNIKGANQYFAFTDEGVWGRHMGKCSRSMYPEDALNEYGLYIGLTAASYPKWNYGLRPAHMIRYVVERCRTTRQALNFMRKVPCGSPINFLIADKKGDVAVVENYCHGIEVLRPSAQGVIVHTNHALASKTQKMDMVFKKRPRSSTFVRYAEAQYLIAQQLPNFQFTDIWRVLRDSHYVYNEDTIWSLALELSEQRFNIYYDTAMGQKQEKFSFKEKRAIS